MNDNVDDEKMIQDYDYVIHLYFMIDNGIYLGY
jgi:hypothetical protein